MNKVIVTFNEYDYSVTDAYYAANPDISQYEDDPNDKCPKPVHKVEVFENVVAHRIGNGAVQIVLPNGVERIIANFYTIDVIPDEKSQSEWLRQTQEAYPNVDELVETTDQSH